MKIDNKKIAYILNSAVIILIGILMLILDASSIINFLCITFGIVVVFKSLNRLLYSHLINKRFTKLDIYNLVDLIVGVIIIFFHNNVLNIIVALVFIILPIIRVVLSKNIKNLKKELLNLIIGIALLVFGIGVISNIILKVFGVIFIILGIINLVLNLINDNNTKKKGSIKAKIINSKDAF